MAISNVSPAPARRTQSGPRKAQSGPRKTKSGSGKTQSAPRKRGGEELMAVVLLAAPANVIMQLALPGVGYGVMESRVEGGRIDKHPIKRTRTTLTYLAVATRGTEEQKAAFRTAVNGAHAHVKSTAESPVKYNAFNKDLQLWVGACLYKGGVDIYRTFIGEMDDETADEHYQRDGKAKATTLQVPEEMWPADLDGFEEYWQEMLDEIHIDDAVRKYLYPIAVGRVAGLRLPGPLQNAYEQFWLLTTTGFLPQKFRDEMRLPWDPQRQQRFDRLMSVFRTVNNLLPRPVRYFPFNVLLLDLDWRIKTGRPLV